MANHRRHLFSIRFATRVGPAEFGFWAGETIHAENSHEYDTAGLGRVAARCGLLTDEMWTDANQYFAVLYLTAVS